MPVTVELDNDGPDARGVLRINGPSFRTDYPIEIARGGKKRLITYPTADYGETSFVLLTDQGRILHTMSPEMKWQQGQQVLLEITDTPGEMAFVRDKTQNNENHLSVQDAYSRPGQSPDRAVGYSGLGAVILGSGSERLSDREVEALKLWTMSGGTLVFLGGASAPILNDSRWADTLPASNFRSVNLNGSKVLRGLAEIDAGEFSITDGTALPNANRTMDGSHLISAERQFGIGRVVYLSMNMLESPLSKWEGRRKAFFKMVRPAELNGRRIFVSSFSRETNSPYNPGGTGIPGAPTPTSTQRDPFSTKLPPASQVFLVLGIYFLAVIPVNFLVLKKLNRGELAWFTAPVISLGFAGLLFTQAQDLYSTQMSSAAQGILVAQEGAPEGVFIGSSQIFIPRGGTYDLKLQDVDSVGVVEQEDYNYGFGRNRSATVELNPVDDGEIHVPELRANNLAFKEVNYRQREPEAGDWFRIRHVGGKTYEVSSNAPGSLKNIVLFIGKQGYRIDGEIKPGEKKRVLATAQNEAFEQPPSLSSVLTSRTLALSGKVSGVRPGPQLGKEIEARTDIRVAFISKEAPGG
jgi:hypothetical protein